jgi:hypothetical protein
MMIDLRKMLALLLGLALIGLVACDTPRRGGDDDDASDDDDATADDDDVSDDDDVVDDDDDVLTDDDDATPDDWEATEFMYAHTGTQLYSIDPVSYDATFVADFHHSDGEEIPNMTDLAVSMQGQMYAVSTNAMWHIAPQTGEVELVFQTKDQFFVALAFLSDGTLLIGGNDVMFVADEELGTHEELATFTGWSWDGDMVGLPDGLLYCAMREDGSDTSTLVVYDVGSETVVSSGTTGVGSLYGIGYAKGVLFGFTDEGEILTIDGGTGAATVVDEPGISWWGATTNPVRWTPG